LLAGGEAIHLMNYSILILNKSGLQSTYFKQQLNRNPYSCIHLPHNIQSIQAYEATRGHSSEGKARVSIIKAVLKSLFASRSNLK